MIVLNRRLNLAGFNMRGGVIGKEIHSITGQVTITVRIDANVDYMALA